MPGIYTPTEAVHAMECGADVLKVFPGDIATPAFIKDIHGPIPNAVMMPSGGVDVDNVKDWIKAGAVAVGAGSSLIKGAKTGDYDLITEKEARIILAAITEKSIPIEQPQQDALRARMLKNILVAIA